MSIDFSRANIEACEPTVHIVDKDITYGLDLFSYDKCSNEESPLIKQSRGLVYYNDLLIMKAFPYSDEYSVNDEKLPTILNDLSEWSFFDSYEGSLVRLFYFRGKWFVSTHRKLDAFRSKWSCKDSFGELFVRALTHETERDPDFLYSLPEGKDILERFQNSLDETKQYMFLVRNNEENRIVCQVPTQEEPHVLHVGTFVNGILSFSDNCGLSKPVRLSFTNIEDLLKYVSNVNHNNLQGIVCFGPDNLQIKVYNPAYEELFKIRGNEPSVRYRYLQLRSDNEAVRKLKELYPNMVSVFESCEATLFEIAQNIYRAYVNRFIKKQYVIIPKDQYKVMSECHGWHIEDRVNHKISLAKVIAVLNSQPATALNHMIHEVNQANKVGVENK